MQAVAVVAPPDVPVGKINPPQVGAEPSASMPSDGSTVTTMGSQPLSG